jgi:hypothetical protein
MANMSRRIRQKKSTYGKARNNGGFVVDVRLNASSYD